MFFVEKVKIQLNILIYNNDSENIQNKPIWIVTNTNCFNEWTK